MKFVQIFRKSTAVILAGLMLGGCVLRDAEPSGAVDAELSAVETLADAAEAEMAEVVTEPVTEAVTEVVPEPETMPVPDVVPEPEVIPEPEPEPVPETPDAVRERRISEELAKMTVREKLGQMFMAAYSDTSAAAIADYAFGAYILFAGNFEFETVDTLSAKMADLQSQAKYGLLTAVDEEGGTVTRISRFTQFRADKFKSPRTLYSWGGMDAIGKDTAEKSALLASLGLNLNMAPVADISVNDGDFMYWRSVGLDAAGTADFVRTVIRESKAGGIGSVAKHFPGYGSVADTHTGMAYDNRSLDELRASDFVPFAAAIEEGVESVLVSHIITSSIDAEKPASVSAKTVALLRDELGYDGIIMTDDLAMAGITDYCATGNAALEAILAGCDMLCCTNWDTQYPAVWAAVESGTITEERLNESAARILRVKYDMGLWE
ncbi:MAG: beta-hexosaminidase [Clostridia bacterium]|nr:beta-hexosaminidase [Clostridia bacterium]